ncbi:MAG TPA: hypothetical protein VGL65_04415 [Gemmatimonadales bacterium]
MNLPRNAQIWWPGWRAARRRTRRHRFDPAAPVTLHLMFADHFEPRWARPSEATARARVTTWSEAWPRIASRIRDSRGQPPRWTFFFPEEEYHPALIDPLAAMTRAGIADVEVHIHHDGEGEADFVGRMDRFTNALARDHGLMHRRDGGLAFGFIHGNWALDNARPDGRWCGLNNEITLLRGLGCYADFTLPAAPDPCQTRLVNAIYWAVDDPSQPRSHDNGRIIERGITPPEGALICVQGPLTLRPHPRWRIVPTLDVAELAGYAPPSHRRARVWLDAAPRIGNDIFLKIYTHGAPEKNAGPLLGGFIEGTIAAVQAECRIRRWDLVFATAWETYLAIETARSGTPS